MRQGSRPAVAPLIASLMLLFLSPSAFGSITHDFAGTVESVSEPNGFTVSVTYSIVGVWGTVEVLLDRPLADPAYFSGMELQFDIMGHDLLGRLVCQAYLDGTSVYEVYDCRLNPVDCSFHRYCSRGRLIGWDQCDHCISGSLICQWYYLPL